ncbi:MAG: right-handed parallel beta-helix repeat-containing protein [Treponemataceae bacterium]
MRRILHVRALPTVVSFLILVSIFSCGGENAKKTADTPPPVAAPAQPAALAPVVPQPAVPAPAEPKAEIGVKPDKEKEAGAKEKAERLAAEKAAATAKAEEAKAGKTAAQAKAAEAVASKAESARLAVIDVSSPAIVTAPGVFVSVVTVTIKGPSRKEALVSYTIDGSEPSATKGLRYSGSFAVSSSALVKAIAYIPGGKKSAVVSADFTIGEVCAAPASSGDGRRTAPLGSIIAAIAKARSLGISQVKIASGSFEESIEIDSPITLVGGFRGDFAAASGSRTVVRGKPVEKSIKKAPAYAIKVKGKAADSKTRIERIEFRGPEASYGAGILVTEDASPEFVDCASFGGDGSYGYGAVALASAAPLFRSCRLSGGGGATSYGLSVDGARATIEGSILSAGTGAVGGYGLVATDAKVSVSASVIAANSANVGYGAAFYNSKGSRLERCTIVGGSGKDASGVFISASDPSIEKCVLWAAGSVKSYGITANYGESAPSLLSRSVFIGCAGGAYYDAQTKTAYSTFNAGRLSTADGKTPSRPQGEGNSLGKFELGAAPLYAIPASAGGEAGAPALTFR